MSGLPDVHRRPVGRATLGDQLRRHARTAPERVALVVHSADGRRVHTYGELDARANAAAHALLGLGVRRGDRVAVMAHNRPEVVVAYYGALKAGAAYTGVNVMHSEREVAEQLAHAAPAVVVADADAVDRVEAVRATLDPAPACVTLGPHVPAGWHSFEDLLAAASVDEPDVEVDEHDLALVTYTSGTEAAPKGVMISHRNYLIATAPAWSWGLRTGPDDTWLFVMPFHTIAGIGSMTTLTQMGATLVLPDGTDPGRSIEIVEAEGVTVVAQTPTFYAAVSAHPRFGADTVASVRRCMTYGGQVSPAVVDGWAAAAPGVVWGTYWGQSELSQLGTVGWFARLDDVPDRDPSWIGKPVTHLEVRVVDADGDPAEIGELLCRGPSVMVGYFGDAERTAAVLDGEWLRTGDVVRVDGQGNLFFHDRIKDMIKSGGYNVSSQEVERVLHEHPAIQRAAVVGLPDERWSEAVTGFVVPRAGAAVDPADVITHCRAHLAPYKVPKAVHVVDGFPTDAQGKILKRELRRTGA